MTIKEDNVLKGYCYFDWRDTGFPNGAYCPGGNDMSIRYDGDDQVLRFYNAANPPPQDLGTILLNGQIITWAELNCTNRDFSPFWSEGLVLIPSENNHPRIVWGPYQESSGEDLVYYIYRATTSNPSPPSLGSFSYIASVPGDTYEFVDDYFLIGGNFYIHYYVKAKFVPTESFSSATNYLKNNLSKAGL